MLKLGLIGHTGFIGQAISQQLSIDLGFNSQNVDTVSDYEFDTLIVAAPTGNRLYVNANPAEDLANVDRLVQTIQTAKFNNIVLIGTVDTINYPDSAYGANRLVLEHAVKLFDNNYVIRLSTLIAQNIKKNILHDLKHGVYLDKLNLNSSSQWCLLDQLGDTINHCINNDITDLTLVSEPVYTYEIVDQFFPELKHLLNNQAPIKTYNIQPTYLSKDQIFQAIDNYLK